MSRGKIMKLQVEQAKEHIGKKFPYSYTIPTSELGDVTAFPWSRHDITINGEFWFDGQNYIVQGSIESKDDYECSRCLTTTEHDRTSTSCNTSRPCKSSRVNAKIRLYVFLSIPCHQC